MASRPSWVQQFLPYQGETTRNRNRLTNCEAVDGRVPCHTEDLREAAEERASALLGRKIKVSHNAYAIARYISSEHGGGSAETKVLLGQLAINRATMRGKSPFELLACTNKWNTCVYGPINVVVEKVDPTTGEVTRVYTAPYKRWAATTRDPSLDDLLIAQFVLDGGAPGFAKGADDQDSPEIVTPRKIREKAADRIYWVGPIPGVNARQVFAWAPRPNIAPDSPQGQKLIAAALQFPSGTPTRLFAAGSPSRIVGVAAAFVGLVGFLAYRYDRGKLLPGRGV